jgi:hypothetical protein
MSQAPLNDANCRVPGDLTSFDSMPLCVRENYDNRSGMTASLEVDAGDEQSESRLRVDRRLSA